MIHRPLKKRLGKEYRRLSRRVRTTGSVEEIRLSGLRGWAIGPPDAPRKITVDLDGQSYELSAGWTARPDIARSFSSTDNEHGFFAHFPATLSSKIYADPSSLNRVVPRCDKKKLRLTENALRMLSGSRPSREADQRSILDGSATLQTASGPVQVRLLGVEAFVVYGAFRGNDLRDSDLVLKLDGEPVECTILSPIKPEESSYASDLQAGEQLFEVELPALIWQRTSEFPVGLEISDQQAGDSVHIELRESEFVRWLSLIAEGVYQGEPYWSLLCLEHLHLCPELPSAPNELKSKLAKLTKAYRLEGYLSASFEPDNSEELERQLRQQEKNSGPVAQLLREFNDSVADHGGQEAELAASLIDKHRLDDDQKFRLLCALSWFFCVNHNLGGLMRACGAQVVRAIIESEEPWAQSVALALLAHQGKSQAAARLFKNVGQEDRFNSAPVRYAIERILAREKRPAIRGEAVSAYLQFLRRLRLDFWSRLMDLQLIEGFVTCLRHRESLDEALRTELEETAMQLYGQCPNFWRRLIDTIDVSTLPDLFIEGLCHFGTMERALLSGSPFVNIYERLTRGNHFFLRYKNRDAIATQHQLISAALSDRTTRERFGKILDIEIRGSSERKKTEFLRYRAHPLGLNSEEFADLNPKLFDALREAYLGKSASETYGLQRDAYEAFQRRHEQGNAPAIKLAQELSVLTCQFLGLDLLSALYAEDEAVIAPRTAYDDALRAAVRVTPAPAPVQAAQARLERAHPQKGLPLSATKDLIGDTLLVVYSCRANLESHDTVIRRTWLQDARERGMLGLVVVGDGDGTIDGDVLSLDVRDDYESLPAKTIELLRWVKNNTNVQYLIKVDDDCSVRIDEYLSGLAYRKHHYHGRRIAREPGQTDRRWHQGKSSTALAQVSLDKLPEPCTFADGGSGYSLSRHAIETALRVVATEEGARLAATTYAEDRLLGYLLSLGGIGLSNEDHYVQVFRKTTHDGVALSRYYCTFHGTQLTPTQITHLDGPSAMEATQALAKTDALLPKKLWPAHERPNVGANQPQIELLMSLEQTERLSNKELYVVAVMYNERTILPRFLEHYRRLGVEAFLITDNASDDGTREYLLEQDDVILYSTDSSYKDAKFGIVWQQAMLDGHCLGRWALVVDADEFLVFPGFEERPLSHYLRDLEANGYDSAWQAVVDMYPDNDLTAADFTKADPFVAAPYFDKAPLIPWRLHMGRFSSTSVNVSSLRHRLIQASDPDMYTSQKHALFRYRPWVRLSMGIHCVTNITPAPQPSALAHFKYHAGFKAKVEEGVARGEHFDNSTEYQAYQSLLAEAQGDFRNDENSAEFKDSRTFLRRWSKWDQPVPRTPLTRSLPESEDEQPFLIWTLQRTGATNLTKFLTRISQFDSVEHEPFNAGRVYNQISKDWSRTGDVEQLRNALRNELSKKVLIQHCVDVPPKRDPRAFNRVLLEVSLEFGYRQIFLVCEKAENEENSRMWLRLVHDELVSRGGKPLCISFEQMFTQDIHVSRTLIVDLLRQLHLDVSKFTDSEEQRLFSGGAQGTKSKYPEYEGAEALVEQAKALDPLAFHHPLGLGSSVVDSSNPDTSLDKLKLRLIPALEDLHYILLGELDAGTQDPGWSIRCGGCTIPIEMTQSPEGLSLLRSKPFVPHGEFEMVDDHAQALMKLHLVAPTTEDGETEAEAKATGRKRR